jgi:pimeloyl-ACP methyl ester carboxylesterase
MKTDNRLALADGRELGWAEFGSPEGKPVLYFHGAPSSRLEPLLVGDDVWRRAGLRVIAPDRPGMGYSDFQTRRGLCDWAPDVVALADSLGLSRFSVLGNSGGGPYVAVCAAKIPERIETAVIVSGGWRMDWPEARRGLPFANRLTMLLARWAPLVLRPLLRLMGNIQTANREKELAMLRKRVPAPDYAAFAVPGRLEAFGQVMRESIRQGAQGPVWDLRLYMRDFGFRPQDVRVPVTMFHGERDTNAPIALAARVASEMPGANLVRFAGEAHLSTLCNHVEEFTRALHGEAS